MLATIRCGNGVCRCWLGVVVGVWRLGRRVWTARRELPAYPAVRGSRVGQEHASMERFKTDALTTRPRQLAAILGQNIALALATGFEPARDHSHQLAWRSTLLWRCSLADPCRCSSAGAGLGCRGCATGVLGAVDRRLSGSASHSSAQTVITRTTRRRSPAAVLAWPCRAHLCDGTGRGPGCRATRKCRPPAGPGWGAASR